MARPIGTLSEKSLHAALKAYYARPGDALECDLGGYVIDVVRRSDDARPPLCVEIQSRRLAPMKPKLRALLDQYPIRIVYPIAVERSIVRLTPDGEIVSRRKSPKRGTVYEVFSELVSFPKLTLHPNFSLEIALIREDEYWLDDGRGSWRRKHWSIHDRVLLEVVESLAFASPADYAALLPADLPTVFDTGTLAQAIHQPRRIGQQMAYCLREMGQLQPMGMQGKARLYARSIA
ncbi:MAG: hypothetical protein U0670_11640 [Anaerolineae bacterium]